MVQSLHEKIQRLEARLRLSQADPRQHLSEPTGDFQNEVHLHQTVDSEDDVGDVQTFAEEVGNLVVGGVDTPWMQYGKSMQGMQRLSQRIILIIFSWKCFGHNFLENLSSPDSCSVAR